MQEQLKNFINELKSAKGLSTYDEATTKQIIIMRILNILGWNIFDIKEVQPEYPVDPQNSNEKVDYALAKDTDNMVFVEVKAVSVDLEDWEEKFCNYCFKNNVAIGVLTNGISWWFYLPRAKGSWYERKFYSINLVQQDIDTVVSHFIDFLSKQNVMSGKSEENAKKTYESRQKNQIIKKSLPQAWNTLISSEDESFIDLFNSMLEKISGYRAESEEIAEFLAKNRARLLISEEQPIQVSRRTREIESVPQIEEERASAYVRSGYTGKRINAFVFNNKRYKARSWKQLLLSVCNEINNLHKKDFEKVLSLKGRKRPYFTKNANELRAPEKIRGTDIFVETNLSANSIVSLCEDVLSLFGYKNSLQIELD
jgi:predicted type IV restriction endonuclease